MLKKYVFHENLGLGISKPYEIKYYYFQKITGNGGKITGNFPLPVMKKNMEILHPYQQCTRTSCLLSPCGAYWRPKRPFSGQKSMALFES